MVEKKPRKTRKDKGKKRGKKRIKNPQFQRGSIDFRTIGTQQTFGPNTTLLAGLVASRAVVPQYLQPQQPQPISTELTTYAPRDLVKNVPPPQFRADTEQAQEETPQATQVRQAMGERIGRLRKEEASLFLRGKVMEAKNMKLGEELQQKQQEIIEQDKSMDLKRKSFLVEQIYTTTSDAGFARIQSQLQGIQWTGKEVKEQIQEGGGIDNYRQYLMKTAGLDPALVDFKEVKAGERGKGRKDYFYNPQKADLQQAQEEKPVEVVDIGELLESDEEPEPKRIPKPFKPSFLPNTEFIDKIQSELKAEEEPRQMSEIEKALQANRKVLKKNELEELQQTAVSLDSRLAQRVAEQKERNKPKLPRREEKKSSYTGPVGRVYYDEQGLIQL